MTEIRGRVLHAGNVSGRAVVLGEPLSMWGGLDPQTGAIIDRRHPLLGQNLAGKVLVMTAGRGSSSSSSVLAEAIRADTAPAGILLLEADEILVLGALVAKLLGGRSMPVVQLDAASFASVRTGDELVIHADGRLEVGPGDA